MPEEGERAPDFTLYDLDKKERRLSEFLIQGKKTILAFFPGAFTGVCTQEMCTFRDMFSELEGLKGQVVGISVDSPFSQKAFAEKNSLNFPLLSDFKKQVVQEYGVLWNGLGGLAGYISANRAIFMLDENGVIRYKWVAPNPGTLPPFDEIKKALQK